MIKYKSSNHGVFVCDHPEQLKTVKDFLESTKATRIRHYKYPNVEVLIIEDHGKYVRISVGGMLGWCLKSDLEEVK